jgi:uncharacterized protein (DUF1684 family)
VTDEAYVREIEEQRGRERAALRTRSSALAAVSRHELPIGRELRIGPGDGADVRLADLGRVIAVRAERDGFLVDGAATPPGVIEAGRYGIRLSHQNHPAVVILDGQSARLREDVERRWYPVEPRFRLHGELEPDGSRQPVASTASAERAALRVGWAHLRIDDVACRLAVTRLLEPGVAADGLEVYFRDTTTGHGSYAVGRYLAVSRFGDGVLVDFNLAYNPACALSPYYNCPIPSPENHLPVPIHAGEMTPRVGGRAAHG